MPIPPPAPRAPRWRKGAGRMLLFLAAVAGHAESAAHGITTGETMLGLNAEGWVYVSLTIFIVGIFWFGRAHHRSEEHTSELQSLMRISYAVFCLKKKKTTNATQPT